MPKEGPIVRKVKVPRPGARRQLGMAVFAVGGLAVLVAAAYLMFRPKEERYLLRSYTTAPVERTDIVESLQLSGTLEVSRTETLLSPAAGFIESIEVEEGQAVESGRVLARIRSQSLDESLSETRLSLVKQRREREKRVLERTLAEEQDARQLERLRKERDTLRGELSRYERLAEAGAATAQELGEAADALSGTEADIADLGRRIEADETRHLLDLTNLDADIRSLEEKAVFLETQLGLLAVRCPFDGRVLDRFVDPGTYVTQLGKLVTIADLSRPVVSVQVPERDIARIAPDQEVLITFGTGTYPGCVRRIGTTASSGSDSYSSTVKVEIEFLEIPERVVPGASAGVEIFTGVRKNTLRLPRGPYLVSGEELYVYRIEDGRAVRTQVAYGVITSTDVEVLRGLVEGDLVITSGYRDFIDFPEIDLDPEGGTHE